MNLTAGIDANETPSARPGRNCRMGNDPKTSVVDKYHKAHDVPNLFITDGSAMASSGCQNPSLTYMALSARAAHHAAEFLREGKI